MADGRQQHYPDIGDYALIGDCRTAALVSRDGSVDWLCLPNFSSNSVFAAILDHQRGGYFSLRPAANYHVSRRYLGNTPILETIFEAADGVLRVRDLMPANTGRYASSLQPQRELLRIVEAIEGEPELLIEFRPRLDYGRKPSRFEPMGRIGWRHVSGEEFYLLRTDLALEASDGGEALYGRARLQAGERCHFSFSYTRQDVATLPLLGDVAVLRLKDTSAWWERWSTLCCYQGPYHATIIRSAITLKLLDHALSGAVIAAPTTSLPEHIGGTRNWDYRFCWLRDAAFTFRSFVELGYRDEADAFLGWLLHSTRLTWPELRVFYDAYGRIDSQESELDHLEGYAGSRPVRIGNGAKDQLQLDVYGEVVLAAYDFVCAGGVLDAMEARMLCGLGESVCRLWREPDEGIWEIRGAPKHYTYSKMMCWVALDRLLRLHEGGQISVPADRFRRECAALTEAIEKHGFNRELNSYVATFDGDQPDGSLLLVARRGYIDARDPRMLGTYGFHERELGANGLIFRYREGFDHLPEPEGAFTACSFWAVDCLVEQGRLEEARERFEHVLSFGNDLGLFAEEIDAATGAQRGNFPQAYSHLALIDAALSLHRARVGKEQT